MLRRTFVRFVKGERGKMVIVRTIVIGLLTGFALCCAVPVWAQQVDISAPAPERGREPIVIPPGDHATATRPSDADYYRDPPKVRYEPAFIGPLSGKTETATSTGRSGVAGWTSPNTPVGPPQTGWRDVTGYFALGFAFEWGGPPPAKRPPAR
jgi:hypothetical protein